VVERISPFQAMLAGMYASPVTWAVLIALNNSLSEPRRLLLPYFGGTLLFCIPASFANLIAWALIAMLGSGLSARNRHLAMGMVGGIMLILLCDLIARSGREIGGGEPIGLRTLGGLVIGAAFNVAMVWAVWRFNWKSNYD
jgi:hypothetical protein